MAKVERITTSLGSVHIISPEYEGEDTKKIDIPADGPNATVGHVAPGVVIIPGPSEGQPPIDHTQAQLQIIKHPVLHGVKETDVQGELVDMEKEELENRIKGLEKENRELRGTVQAMFQRVQDFVNSFGT